MSKADTTLGNMKTAMQEHRRELKSVENELLGEAVGQLSIEDVRRRRNKLRLLKSQLGMTAEDEEIPPPWGKTALGWNAKGSVHMIALWEHAEKATGNDRKFVCF